LEDGPFQETSEQDSGVNERTEKEKTMRLSERLLLGSLNLRPLRGVTRSSDGESGCALGMIYSVGGYSQSVDSWMCITKGLEDPSFPYECGCDPLHGKLMGAGGGFYNSPERVNPRSMIIHLFNQHVCATDEEVACGIERWSIERLAEWLEKVEPKREASVPIETEEALEYQAT
jgi:hypothetical protein